MPWADNWPGQDQEQLRKNANQSSGNFWGGIGDWWNQITRPVKIGPIDQAEQQRIAGMGYGFSNRDQMGDLYERSLGPTGTTKQTNPLGLSRGDIRPSPLASGSGETHGTIAKSGNPISDMISRLQGMTTNQGIPSSIAADTRSPEEIQMADAIAAIQRRLADPNGYALDESYKGMVDDAFAGAYGAVDNAENRSRENYATSDKVIQGLTEGHVNAIKGEDMDLVKKIGAENQAGISGIYDNSQKSLEADRTKEINDRAAAIQRFGLQESGLGDVGSVQNEQIAKNNGIKTASLNQAQGFQAADEQLNVARASAQASEGVSRQSQLRQDLDKILGGLDNKRAEIGNSKAQANLAGRQAAVANAQKAMALDSDTLNMYLDNKREDRTTADKLAASAASKAKGSADKFTVVGNRLSEQGIDAPPLLQAYSEVVGANDYNSNSGFDKKAHYINKMKAKLKGRNYTDLDIAQAVNMLEGYGTDKATALG